MRFIGVLGLLFYFGCSSDNPNSNNNNSLPDLSDPNNNNNLPDLSDPNNNNSTDMALQIPCTCPQGFSCDSSGQCVGGNPGSLVLDVKTVKVSGTVTVNGAIPAIKPACTPTTVEATVHLVDAARGHSFEIPVLCSASGAAFDGVVFPGDYKVSVSGDPSLSDLPDPAYPMADLTLSADKSNLALDLKLIAVDGTITLNNVAPVDGVSCNDVIVELTPVAGTVGGSFFDLEGTCGATTTFSGKVFPGTYDVTILGVGDSATNLQHFRIATPVNASSDKHGLAFDVKTVNVGGSITIDSIAPTPTDCTDLVGADVRFTENKTGVSTTRIAACTTNVLTVASFKLFAGEYTVTFNGNGGAGLGFDEYPVRDKFTVSQNQTSEVFNATTATTVTKMVNVGGAVTLNGNLPVSRPGCFGAAAQVVFEDAMHHATQFDIDCGTNTFTGMVPTGVYDITVHDVGDDSDLLAPGFPAAKAVNLQADKTNFAFDEKTVTVSGKVTLNGQDPATVGTCSAGGQQFEGTVHLSQMDGPAFDLPIPCSAGIFAWTGQVYPGTYTASVDGRNGSSSLPDESFKLAAAVDANTTKSGINIDVLTTSVAGKLLLNGMAPATTTQCNANPNSHKATVELSNLDHGVTFSLPVLCSSMDFSWTGVVFPGTYRISVSGAGGFSSLPKNTYLAVPKLKL